MKKFIFLLAMCFSVTTLFAFSPPDKQIKTDTVLTFEKSKEVVDLVAYDFKLETYIVSRETKVFKPTFEAVLLPKNELFFTIVLHRYCYKEKLKFNYLIDISALIKEQGLKNRQISYC